MLLLGEHVAAVPRSSEYATKKLAKQLYAVRDVGVIARALFALAVSQLEQKMLVPARACNDCYLRKDQNERDTRGMERAAVVVLQTNIGSPRVSKIQPLCISISASVRT